MIDVRSPIFLQNIIVNVYKNINSKEKTDTFVRLSFYNISIKKYLSMLALLTAGSLAIAAPSNVTDAELALTASFCPDTMGFKYGDATHNTSPNAKKWVSLMGKGFWAMHHYCWAQINQQRALRPGLPPAIRHGLYVSILADYNYVVINTDPDFIMLPDIYTRMGETELKLSKPLNASKYFSKARELKPDYWPAYLHWSEYLLKSGKKSEALEILKTGIEHSPHAKPLIELYRVAGGNPENIIKKTNNINQQINGMESNNKNPEAPKPTSETIDSTSKIN